MRIDFNRAPSALLVVLAVLVMGCSKLADPEDTAPGDSMFELEPGEDDPNADPPPPQGQGCVVAGQTFANRGSVPSGDSCNGCTCYEGAVICTAVVCEPVICSGIVEGSDSVCSRFPLDPCISLDPDCGANSGAACETGGQSFPDGSDVPSGDTCNRCTCEDGTVSCTERACDPVVCAEIIEASDGVCSRLPLDPCLSEDPDCGGFGPACEAAGQSFPDGSEVPSGDACNRCNCDDGAITCTEIACEPVVCDEFVEDFDGVCSRFPLDPCLFQDPDCGGSANGSCETAGQSFPNRSEIPSGDTCNSCGCYDGTVICTELACEPVFCAELVEESDGVCSRFPLDPCISQDPDCGSGAGACEVAGQRFPNGAGVPSGDDCNSCACSEGNVICTDAACEPVVCPEFVEEADGVCSRFPLDPCLFQDPDCLSAI
jgi:hypothetical protein